MFKLRHIVGLIFFGGALLLVACASVGVQHEFAFENLLGEWRIVEGTKTQIESWQATDSGYRGKGVVLSSADTTFVEELSIFKRGDKWVYQAKVSGQNNDLPVEFIQENQTGTTMAFANYTHDFPQRIVYELISENEMQVYIEGPRDGEKIRIVMDFKRNSQ